MKKTSAGTANAKTTQLDLSRSSSDPCAHFCGVPFEGQGTFVAESRVFSAWIGKSIDLRERCGLYLSSGLPSVPPDELRLQCLEEGFCIKAFPDSMDAPSIAFRVRPKAEAATKRSNTSWSCFSIIAAGPFARNENLEAIMT